MQERDYPKRTGELRTRHQTSIGLFRTIEMIRLRRTFLLKARGREWHKFAVISCGRSAWDESQPAWVTLSDERNGDRDMYWTKLCVASISSWLRRTMCCFECLEATRGALGVRPWTLSLCSS